MRVVGVCALSMALSFFQFVCVVVFCALLLVVRFLFAMVMCCCLRVGDGGHVGVPVAYVF